MDTSELLESLFDAIPDVIGIQDRNYGIIRYNAAGYKFLNMTHKEIEGKKCYELIGRNTPCDICATTECYKTKKPTRVEKYVEEMDVWLDVRAYPILDENGKIVNVIEHLRDITDDEGTFLDQANGVLTALGMDSLGGFKGEAFGLGPAIKFTPKIGGRDINLIAKWLHDIDSTNRFESDILMFSIAFKF